MALTYKQQFIKFMVESGVLKFGTFTLKSGRIAPYFINTGNYKTGEQLARLGEYYAACYADNGIQSDCLVGPAYKGIPLAVTTAVSLWNNHKINVNYCFDRKEAKDHGEGGLFVGHQLAEGQKVTIIEDVMTSGKALREILPKLEAQANVQVAGMIISVDRMEKGLNSDLSAVQEVYRDFGVKVFSIATMSDIISAIEDGIIEGSEYLEQMKAYLLWKTVLIPGFIKFCTVLRLLFLMWGFGSIYPPNRHFCVLKDYINVIVNLFLINT